jgi:hypothetical protein
MFFAAADANSRSVLVTERTVEAVDRFESATEAAVEREMS